MSDISRQYPYLPEGRKILYVPEDNEFMQAAKEQAKQHLGEAGVSTGAVIVKDGEIVGRAGNQTVLHGHMMLWELHKKFCFRKILGVKTGTRYWLCPGCSDHHYHAERRAVDDAHKKNNDTGGADLYMWGHWWCCEPCWKAMIEAGISNVYLLEDSENFFS